MIKKTKFQLSDTTGKSKTHSETRCRNTNDFTKGCVPASLDFTKFEKTTGFKTQPTPNSLAYSSNAHGLDTNSIKNTCKKGRESGTIKNQMDNNVIYVYRTEIEPDVKKPCYDHQVKCVHRINDNDDVKNEIYSDYWNANFKNVTIYKNTDDNADTIIDYDDYFDYISQKTYTQKSNTEIKQFMETCDLVFDKFTDILFDTVTSDYNVN